MSVVMYGETWHFERTNADGSVDILVLNKPWGIKERGNFGSPPTEWEVDEQFDGDGARPLRYNIQPRLIGMTVTHEPAESRLEYWAIRRELFGFIRPNQFKPVKLILTRDDGTRWALRVRPNPGAPFPPIESSSFAITETLAVIAHQPYFFDPVPITYPFNVQMITGSPGFIFPITFPIRFGSTENVRDVYVFDYEGDMETYPKFTIEGPYTTAIIEHLGTGAKIEMMAEIEVGETRIIDTDASESPPNVTNGYGEEVWYETSIDTNLADFSILPSNLVVGQQRIAMHLTGVGDETSANLKFETRYYGM